MTWWKNNVERKSKFNILQNDAKYIDDNDEAILAADVVVDNRKLQRARWCRLVISLAGVIRTSAGSSGGSKSALEARIAANVICRQSLDHLCVYLQANGQQLVNTAGEETMAANDAAKQFTVARLLANNTKNNKKPSAASASADTAQASMIPFHDDIDYDLDVMEYEQYQDFADDSDSEHEGQDSTPIPFPTRLFDVITEESKDSHGCLIWRAEDNGASFRIRDLSKFVAEDMHHRFKLRNFSSFQRLLHLHGFVRVSVPLNNVLFKSKASSSSSSSSSGKGSRVRVHTSPATAYTTPGGLTLRVLRSDQYVYSHPQFHQGRRNMVGSIARTALSLESPKMTPSSSSSSSSSSSTSAVKEGNTSLMLYGGNGGNVSNSGIRVGNKLGSTTSHKKRAPATSSSSTPAVPLRLVFGDDGWFFTNDLLPPTQTALRPSHHGQQQGVYQNVTPATSATRKRKHTEVGKTSASISSSGGAGVGAVSLKELASTRMDECVMGNDVATGDDNDNDDVSHIP